MERTVGEGVESPKGQTSALLAQRSEEVKNRSVWVGVKDLDDVANEWRQVPTALNFYFPLLKSRTLCTTVHAQTVGVTEENVSIVNRKTVHAFGECSTLTHNSLK